MFECPAIFACPDFVERGLDDSVEIPAVSDEYVLRVADYMRYLVVFAVTKQ